MASAASPAGQQAPQAVAQSATAGDLKRLEDLPWDNSFVRELPGDPERKNVVRQVTGALYSRVHPTPPSGEPRVVAYSRQVAELIGLQPLECERPEFGLVMAGAAGLPGTEPYAQCYGGHQFGQWAGQLGDGRAITLGEVAAPAAPQQASSTPGDTPGYIPGAPPPARWELQLKGAGKTPYSRRADGRAVLRSSIREYVASEAMAALGVPTTRALCCVATGDQVLRDMFYNGDAKWEPGAVVCRVAPSFVRFGTFQLPASRGQGEEALVRTLADYVIRRHFPRLAPRLATAATADPATADPATAEPSSASGESGAGSGSSAGSSKPVYAAWFEEVCARTGRLVAAWQSLGFVHGVLNTDNMCVPVLVAPVATGRHVTCTMT